MKGQPKQDYKSNDVVYTPSKLASQIVGYFNPTGKMLEPCKGGGAFLNCMPGADWCEISEGKDFYSYNKHVDWIITNPPWSKITDFLKHSLDVADNVVFLVTVNHLWTECRVREIENRGFAIKEILLVKWPPASTGFPRSGFQLAAIHMQKGWKGKISMTRLNEDAEAPIVSIPSEKSKVKKGSKVVA